MSTEQIQLGAESCALARSWSNLILRADRMRNTPNYTGLSMPDRYYIGFLGELAFAQWLDGHHVPYTHRVCLSGQSSANEFSIDSRDAGTMSVEIKTGSVATHRHFMYPAAQTNKCGDVNVGARVEMNAVDGAILRLMGWLNRSEAEHLPVRELRVRTRSTTYENMRAMPALLERLSRVTPALPHGRQVTFDPASFSATRHLNLAA